MGKWRKSEKGRRSAKEEDRREKKERKKARKRGEACIDYRKREATLRCLGFSSYAAYLGSELWRGIRARVRERDGGRCRICLGKGCSVHHRSYDSRTMRGEALEKLVWICRRCHDEIERDGEGKKRSPLGVERAYRRLVYRMRRERESLLTERPPTEDNMEAEMQRVWREACQMA
jgi:hypothetical protein